MNENALLRMNLENELRHAIERKEMSLHYQPQIDLTTGKVTGPMAESMKLQVTAEGVEPVGQVQFLRQEKCDEAQGFHISRPMTAADAEHFLREFKD